LQPAKAIIIYIYGQRAIFATESRTNRHETALEGNRAITWVVILVVINTIAIAVGLLFMVPTWAASQESEHSQENANDFARSALRNEVKAETNDHSHWMLKLETEKSRRKEIDEVVETENGDLKRPILINDRPLTARQQHEADEQIRRLVSNPGALRKSLKEQNDDAAHSQRMLKLLPQALIFRFGQRRSNAVELLFSPNSHFRPPTREAQVFQAMEGSLWIDSKQQRLMELSGHLTREVKFGGGFFGHLNAGGQFHVKQMEVAQGYWEMTLLHVDMKGKALFFKTISVRQKLERSDFHQVSDSLTLAEAADLLHKQTVAVAVSAGRQ
jgi:hypothetical protein